LEILEESESENQALTLYKWKKDPYKPGFQGRNFKRYRPNFPQGKGKQPMHWREKPYCKVCGKNHDGPCSFVQCFECREMGHKRYECPKMAWNQTRAIPSAEQSRPPVAVPRGRPPMPRGRPQAGNPRKPQAGGRVYCLEAEEEGDGDPHVVVSSTFIVNTLPTTVFI